MSSDLRAPWGNRIRNTARMYRMRIERTVAGISIVSGGLGLGIWMFLSNAGGSLPLLSLLGLLSGMLVWRRHAGGHGAGLLFYALQLVGYHSYDAIDIYPLRSILSLAYVVHLPAGVLIVNLLALAMMLASATLLRWPYGRPGA